MDLSERIISFSLPGAEAIKFALCCKISGPNQLEISLTDFTNSWTGKGNISKWKAPAASTGEIGDVLISALESIGGNNLDNRDGVVASIDNLEDTNAAPVISWSSSSSDSSTPIGSIELQKAATAETAKIVFETLSRRKNSMAKEHYTIQKECDQLLQQYEPLREDIKRETTKRALEYRNILAGTKVLLDSKRNYKNRLEEKAVFDAKQEERKSNEEKSSGSSEPQPGTTRGGRKRKAK